MGQKKQYPRLDVRVSQAQLDRWKRLAQQQQLTLPQLVRKILDRATERAGVE